VKKPSGEGHSGIVKIRFSLDKRRGRGDAIARVDHSPSSVTNENMYAAGTRPATIVKHTRLAVRDVRCCYTGEGRWHRGTRLPSSRRIIERRGLQKRIARNDHGVVSVVGLPPVRYVRHDF